MADEYGTGQPKSYPKRGPETQEELSPGCKQVKAVMLRPGQAADIGTSPPSRVFTKDYCKTELVEDDPDTVSPYLGNPLAY